MLSNQMRTCFAASMEEARAVIADHSPEVYIVAHEWLCEHGGLDLIKKSRCLFRVVRLLILFFSATAMWRLDLSISRQALMSF